MLAFEIPSLPVLILLFVTGIVGGVINAIAGGSTFITFPIFIATGLPPFIANASNFVALLPGNAMALIPLRKELVSACKRYPLIIILSLVAGVCGSLALLAGPSIFAGLVPWMLLLATTLYALTEPAMRFARKRFPNPSPALRRCAPILLAVATCFVAFYCGYFGAGVGFLFLSLLTIAGIDNMVTRQAVKNLSLAFIGVISVSLYAYAGIIAWPQAITTFAGAVIGGLCGGTIIQRVNAKILHYVILTIGVVLTAGFFLFPPS